MINSKSIFTTSKILLKPKNLIMTALGIIIACQNISGQVLSNETLNFYEIVSGRKIAYRYINNTSEVKQEKEQMEPNSFTEFIKNSSSSENNINNHN